MSRCPLCNTSYPDGTAACELDGTSLAASNSQTASIALQDLSSRQGFRPSPTVLQRPSGKRQSLGFGSIEESDLTAAAHPSAMARVRDSSRSSRIASGSGTADPVTGKKSKWSEPFVGENAGLDAKKSEDWIGHTLGSYKLLSILGKGGMGCVFKAEHVKLGREVALKVLRSDYAKRKDAVARFFQEARAVNKIRHRNIVDITDLVELDDGTVFIIMEFLDGLPLSKIMRAAAKEDPDTVRILNLLIQICDGLTAAHSVGIVHRDLKPDNIVVTIDYEGKEHVTLLDFGVAKLLEKGKGDDIGLNTVAGSVVGTPAFMSPEQAGGLQVDGRADIYSLGAIMYEMFARQPLFRGKSFKDFVRMHLNEMPVTPSKTKGGATIDPAIEATIMMCLQKSPNARFQSAKQLRADLLSLLSSVETGGELTGHLENLKLTGNPVGDASPLITGEVRAEQPATQNISDSGQSYGAAPQVPAAIIPPPVPANPIQSQFPISVPASQPGYPTPQTHQSQPGYPTPQTHQSQPGYPAQPNQVVLSGTQNSGRSQMASMYDSTAYPAYPSGGYNTPATHTLESNGASDPYYDSGLTTGTTSKRLYFVAAGAALAALLLALLLTSSSSKRSSEAATKVASDKPVQKQLADEEPSEVPGADTPAVTIEAISDTPRTMYQIRLNSIPGAKLYAKDSNAELCTSPCDLIIKFDDGKSRTVRSYRFEAPGFQNTDLTLDLTQPNEPLSFPMHPIVVKPETVEPDTTSGKSKSRKNRNSRNSRNNPPKDLAKDPPKNPPKTKKPKCKVGTGETFNPFSGSKDCR